MFNTVLKGMLLIVGAVGITVLEDRIEIELTWLNMILFALFVVVFAVGLVDLIKELRAWISKIF